MRAFRALAIGMAAFAFSGPAYAGSCNSPGFLADLACEAGIIDEDTARAADGMNAAMGQPVDNAIYAGMDYVVPGSGTAARAYPQVRGAIRAPQQNSAPAEFGDYGSQNAPAPENLWPGQSVRIASVCMFSQGVVPMGVAQPVGTPCVAYTSWGNFPGIAQ